MSEMYAGESRFDLPREREQAFHRKERLGDGSCERNQQEIPSSFQDHLQQQHRNQQKLGRDLVVSLHLE